MVVITYAIGPLATGSGVELIQDLLFREDATSRWSWSIARFFASLVSYASGCAGGIFAPSLSIGASLSSQIAQWVSPGYASLMVLLGMLGFLTGVTRTPLTSFVLVVEMSDPAFGNTSNDDYGDDGLRCGQDCR